MINVNIEMTKAMSDALAEISTGFQTLAESMQDIGDRMMLKLRDEGLLTPEPNRYTAHKTTLIGTVVLDRNHNVQCTER